MLQHDTHRPYLRSFDVHYSLADLVSKADVYDLDEQALLGEYAINIDQLKSQYQYLESQQSNDALNQLFIHLATWPSRLPLAGFVDYINGCIALWVEASNQGVTLAAISNSLKCVLLQPDGQSPSTNHFQLFLSDLLSESLYSHQSQQIRYLLNHDAVTNLPNTHLLLQDLNAHINPQQTTELTLLSVRFLIERGANTVMPILPTALSITIAELLGTCFPSEHSLYQSGNLFFNVLMHRTLNDAQLHVLIAKIQHCFEQQINVQQQSFLVTPVIGALIPTGNESAEAIYNQARLALNQALTLNKHFVLYSAKLAKLVQNQHKLELDIINAFNSEDLELYFQPIVSLPEAHCVGAEVLLRWPDAPTKGVYPNVMVEVINKVGLGRMFTRWLVHSVCRLAGELIHQHQLPIYLTLNLRAEDLYDKDLPLLILQSAQLWRIQPQDIILEITENGILEENETTLATIQQLTQNGFKLALDDFGTGYSSMARLRNMPISLIKIDQSFVKNIHVSEDDFRIVQSIAQLATSLDKEVLVEGIENLESLQLINKIGIKKGQGYYFSKPMPFDEFVRWASINAPTQS